MKITKRLNTSHMQVVQALCADPEHVLQGIQRMECMDAISEARRLLQQVADVREDLANQRIQGIDEALCYLGKLV